ncbi:uncharacterized protein [Venturia canescens]|uniref:uncharacterized protein n=1 Tax=Venturia canescens TaxID=32260 RepID=UPI001C9D0958|nr:uncharacterized protein LOC122412990 [Venturia canescens]
MRVTSGECTLVYFNVKTSGGSKVDDIVQLASRASNGAYSTWIEVSSGSGRTEKRSVEFEYENGEPFYRGDRVEMVSLEAALRSFLAVLQSLKKPAVLVSRTESSGFRPLVQAIKRTKMSEKFIEAVVGFADLSIVLRKASTSRGTVSRSPLSEEERKMLNDEDEPFYDASRHASLLRGLSTKLSLESDICDNIRPYTQVFPESARGLIFF